MSRWGRPAAGLALFLAGFLAGRWSTPATPAPAAVPEPSTAAAPAPAASASGPQTVTGHAPPAANGFPAIVILEPQVPPAQPAPQESVPFMDQVQQSFIPPLLLVRTGQPTEFRNNDEVLHNVRVRDDDTKQGAFNVAIPTGEKYTFTFARDGFYDVGCDIHPGMAAQIVSTSSPYATLADNEGAFVIEQVPPGAYTAVVYASGARSERLVTIDGTAPLDLTRPQ